MVRMAARTAAGAIFVLAAATTTVGAADAPPDMTRRLLQGCLAPPSLAATAQLAATVGATPFAEAANKHALVKRDTVTVPDARVPGEADRIESAITAFQGWTLPGPGGGQLAFVEEADQRMKIEQATGRPIGTALGSRSRACRLSLPVASGRAAFEAYEALNDGDYGALITSDRRHVIVFRFRPDAYDIELDIGLPAPLPVTPVGAEKDGPSRIVLSDGGARFINDLVPGIASLSLSRAALLAGLDRPATIGFANTALEPAAPAPRPAVAP